MGRTSKVDRCWAPLLTVALALAATACGADPQPVPPPTKPEVPAAPPTNAEMRVPPPAKPESPAVQAPRPETPAVPPANAISATIQAVDNRANIVVLSAGKKEGVEAGMEFTVTQGGETVATVVIDKVFPNYASGAVKAGSGTKPLRPGDSCTSTKAPSASVPK